VSASEKISDLTGKARIRNAALHLFAVRGYANTSLRQIALRANVSLSLVTHHYYSKEQLKLAVDCAVLASFEQAIDSVLATNLRTVDEVATRMAEAIGEVIGTRPEVRSYIRRAVFDQVAVTDSSLMERLLELMDATLARMYRAGILRRDAESNWRPAQMLLLIFGPVVFDWLLKPHAPETANSETMRTRCQSGLRLLMHDLSTTLPYYGTDTRGQRIHQA
jgi:AcrR family transcriptional regulator